MPHDHFDRNRRRLLQWGLGAGFALPWGRSLLASPASQAASETPPIRACILIFYYGGPSHLDTWDLKPQAPSEVRGEFQPIATAAPGVQISEHLPRMAKVMDRVAIVRSVYHSSTLHDAASIHALTGRQLEGPDRELFAPLPQFYPSFGSAVAYSRRQLPHDVPFASLPYVFHNVVPTPCQGGGFLGSAYDPLRIDVDLENRRYQAEALQPAAELSTGRISHRRDLLQRIDPTRGVSAGLEKYYDRAYRLLASENLHRALDITREPQSVRDRYGFSPPPPPNGGNGGEMGYAREMRGQNLLLARRLVEADVPFVTVYDYRQQGQNWDAHAQCANQHKSFLLPQADQALSALIEDLTERGLLDSTLIVATGEFGRTPKINANAGRDHWPQCYSVVLAGGGIQGGAVYGASDRLGAFPATDPVTPGDLAATIYWRFGLDPASEIHDQTGRPHRLASGESLARLF